MNDILDRYGDLLEEVDRWFDGCLERHPEMIACHRGCSACCRGLFDITLLDALYLKRGFDLLTAGEQEEVRERSVVRLAALAEQWPGFRPPWTLDPIPEDLWDAFMPEEDETPCPLLSDAGGCRVYRYRPMTCRLNGIPLMDTSGEELFDEWCTLNFAESDPRGIEDLRHPFNELFTQEQLLFRELTRRLLGRAVNELDTIVPASVFLDDDMLELIRISQPC